MERKKNMHVWKTVNSALPADIFPGSFLLELLGAERVLIEDHQGIQEYGDEKICVKTKFGSVAVFGKNLRLSCLSKEQLVIIGPISQITVNRRDC